MLITQFLEVASLLSDITKEAFADCTQRSELFSTQTILKIVMIQQGETSTSEKLGYIIKE